MYSEGDFEVSEGWRQIRDLSTTIDPNISSTTHDEDHFCKLILYKEIKDSRVRIWDVIILIPNLLFLLFIAVRFNRARLKLRATSSPIYLAFYGLVICSVVISVIRCVVSMTVNAAANVGGKVDKVLWVTVRFFLLSTEMSVVIFGLAFGHLDSRSSIRRVLLATSFIALVFTISQGTLELVLPDDTFHIPSRDFYVFGHGGMMFWFCSSIVFTMIYLFILILPYTRLRERLTLPTRKCFYIYASLLATLDLVQSIGAGLLNYTQNPIGLCVVDLTAAMYLTLFTPLVYHTFLSEFLGVSQPGLNFSYKAQVDDAMDEDTVSLPHQQSFSSLKTDSDYIYQVHTPCFHAPLFLSQTHTKVSNPSTTASTTTSPRLASSSSHTTLLYHDYIAQRRLFSKSQAHVQTSAPDLRAMSSVSPEPADKDDNKEVASTSKSKLSPRTASKLVSESEDGDSKSNLISSEESESNSSILVHSKNDDTITACKSDTSLVVLDKTDSELVAPEKEVKQTSPTSPELKNSLQNILDSESDEKNNEEKITQAGLSEYLKHMQSSAGKVDDNEDNMEVEILPYKSKTPSFDSMSSQSETL